MKATKLTLNLAAARTGPMQTGKPVRAAGYRVRFGRRAARAVLVGMLAMAPLAACVNVSAPDKPIVIELNINIRQEVIYKLAADAANTIEENKDVF